VPLPKQLRSLAPARLRDHSGLRAVALGAGLIPPRTMHSQAEAAALARLAADARVVVEIGVFEGSSAVVLAHAMGPSAELHLVDPFEDSSGWALRPGAQADPRAARLAVRRAAGRSGPALVWHRTTSERAAGAWDGRPVDLVFVDGDHSPEGCRLDWDLWHPFVAPGGAVAFHDARLGRADGTGGEGPTQVVDELFRGESPPPGWAIAAEVDSLVVVQRTA
jgi:MMP 1-O-methyltransferase